MELYKPGDTLLETLEFKNLNKLDFALSMELTLSEVNDIIFGIEPITIEISKKLENILGIPVSFWLNAENNYRNKKAQF